MPFQPRQYIALGAAVLATIVVVIAIAFLAGRDNEEAPEPGDATLTPTAAETASPPPTAAVTSTPSPTQAPATSTPATVAPSPQPTSPPATTPTAAATRAPIFIPSVTPTPAIPGEPIASTANIPRDALPVVEFLRGQTLIARLPVEVPRREEYSVGLSGRRVFENDRGMLFHYADQGGAFWMQNTHFDLSIAFVQADETIVDIQEMQAESTNLVNARAPYKYAIEAPAGWYLRNGVRVGDRAHLAFTLPPYLQGS